MLGQSARAFAVLAFIVALPVRARAESAGASKEAPAVSAKAAASAASPTPTATAPVPSATTPEPKASAAPTTVDKPAPAAPPAAKPPASAAPKKTSAKKPAPKKSSQKGRAPRRPRPTLPAGAEKPTPNDAARKRIAGGTLPAARRDTDDPELKALRDADRVLFPKPLPGSTPGWSWDLPKPAAGPGTEVEASGLPPAVALDPGLGGDADVATDAEWIRSLTLPDLPVRLESRVVRYLKFYRDNPKGKAIARVWARKSGRFVPALKAELAKAGLPTDLVWLSLIESGHNPTIVSPAGAAGLWQFMPAAGRLYGLSVDRWVDERFDPKRETDAAILYLSDLHRRFGNWELAMAAYNMGYAGLTRAIRKFNSNDYWELCRYEAGIPWETTLYVPKIFAIAVVMANKKAFGLDDVKPDTAESFDAVVAAPGLSLSDVAEAAKVSSSTIEALNPQFLAGRVPPALSVTRAKYKVRVPSGVAKRVGVALAKLGNPEPGLEPYVVRMGDTLSGISAMRGGDSRSIVRTNQIKDGELLEPGTIILVPRRSAGGEADSDDPIVVVSPREFRYPDRERVFYRVRGGDTLGKIAEAFSVSRGDLESWNALDPSARLQAGMTLQVWTRPGSDLSRVKVLQERDARVLVAGTPGFFDYFEGQNGKKRILVEARAGDTLASVGRRYGMSTGWMERVNRMSRKKQLSPGDRLVVYVPIGTAAAGTANASVTPEPLPEIQPPEPTALPGTSDAEPRAEDQPASEATDRPVTGG
jgi:membrane-bound lytic murein transglycosylase D